MGAAASRSGRLRRAQGVGGGPVRGVEGAGDAGEGVRGELEHPRLADRYEVTEDDVRAFMQLRQSLRDYGISLLDVVIFDQEFHWWSLHELTSGTTVWPTAPKRSRRRH